MTALAEHASRYIAVRRAVGFKLTDTAGLIDSLVAHVDGLGVEHLRVDAVSSWGGPGPLAERPAAPPVGRKALLGVAAKC